MIRLIYTTFFLWLLTTGNAIASDKGLVLVAGATGGTGKLVVEQLLQQGYSVRAMVRSIEKGKKVLGNDIELVKADVTQKETLAAAVNGTDYIISTIGTPIGAEGTNNPENVDYLGVVALIDTAKAAQSKKFILVTSGGTTWWTHPLNWFGDGVLTWKHKSELHLRASGLNHVILRPAGGLTDEPLNTKKIKFTQSDGIPSTISRADVAAVAVAALTHPESDNKTFEIQDDEEGQLSSEVNWQSTFEAMTIDSDNF
ncbi:SDR family oxidoreductase [Oceanicoccus sagamiensis]|uniref:NAD(P)-binding domain-containing protein n=1 Tax=Oceanicoccus sagamiensis TaxID=716816 RepID=A0A1X9NBX6_9GAMM|nr:SDR family oxidoreductase [Oceanicoccus sagamiensis]ARN73405.1 hypothetical protein BST96_04330 [Oceanicoccus sagamiensis]